LSMVRVADVARLEFGLDIDMNGVRMGNVFPG
jgi:hypothetical protein